MNKLDESQSVLLEQVRASSFLLNKKIKKIEITIEFKRNIYSIRKIYIKYGIIILSIIVSIESL